MVAFWPLVFVQDRRSPVRHHNELVSLVSRTWFLTNFHDGMHRWSNGQDLSLPRTFEESSRRGFDSHPVHSGEGVDNRHPKKTEHTVTHWPIRGLHATRKVDDPASSFYSIAPLCILVAREALDLQE